jgi:hypothetical protein
MPSKSKKQYDLMKIASYNKEFAEKRHIDQDAAREWHKADKEMEKKDKDFYKNLPDHAEDKKKKKPAKKRTSQRRKREKGEAHEKAGDASMEGVVSSILDLFRSSQTIDDIPDAVSDSVIQKLSADPNALAGMELRTGPVDVRGVNTHFLLKTWSNNWLSDVEAHAKAIDAFYKKFIPARAAYGNALKKIYDQCEKMSPSEALAYAKPRVNMEKIKLGRMDLPDLKNFAVDFKRGGHGYKLTLGTPGKGPDSMEALSEGAIRKVVSILGILLRGYDYEDEDDYGWYLDDTDEAKFWMRNFPDEDEITGELLSLFPCAGDWYEFAYDDVLDMAIEKMYLGLKGLVMKSIK